MGNLQMNTTKSIKLIIGFLALVSLGTSSLAQDANHPLTLRDAVGAARSNNPLLRESREKINQAEDQIPQ
jgi:hypothetical protein